MSTLANLANVEPATLARLAKVSRDRVAPTEFEAMRKQPRIDFSDCSAFIRLLPNATAGAPQVLVAHTTWSNLYVSHAAGMQWRVGGLTWTTWCSQLGDAACVQSIPLVIRPRWRY